MNLLPTIFIFFLSIFLILPCSYASNEELEESLRRLSFLPHNIKKGGLDCTNCTHTPKQGQTIYVTEEATISLPSRTHGETTLRIIDPPEIKDLFIRLNHHLYFNGYGGRANHLFVSLKLGYKRPQSFLSWKNYSLCWNETNYGLTFVDMEEDVDQNSYADFYNLASEDWQKQKLIEFNRKKVKFISHSSDGIEGVTRQNQTHSESAALGFLNSQKSMFLHAIQSVPTDSKIKVLQLRLHSFLDFCGDCENMVEKFQRKFKIDLLNYLRSNLSKNYILPSSEKILFLVNGFNNRLYKLKTYYSYLEEREQPHTFSGYFLQRYCPFPGKLTWQKNSENRLITFVNEAIAQPEDVEDVQALPAYMKQIIPLNRSAIYWWVQAHHLYDDVKEFMSILTPNLLMVDLNNARLGIREDDDDGESYSASKGKEFIQILKSLSQCSELHYLNLSENWITAPKVANELSSLSSRFNQLSFLSLANTGLQDKMILQHISLALKALPFLQHLDLSRNGFNSDQFVALQEGLCKLNQLITVDLSRNQLAYAYDFESDYKGSVLEDTTESLEWIIDYIKGAPSLRTVNVKRNGFKDFSFFWGDIRENVELTKTEMQKAYKKLKIEYDAGDGQPESESGLTSEDEVVDESSNSQ